MVCLGGQQRSFFILGDFLQVLSIDFFNTTIQAADFRFFDFSDKQNNQNQFRIIYYNDKTNKSRVYDLGDQSGFVATRVNNFFLKALLYLVCALSRRWSLVVVENVHDNIPLDNSSAIITPPHPTFQAKVTLFVETVDFKKYRGSISDDLVFYHRCSNSYVVKVNKP